MVYNLLKDDAKNREVLCFGHSSGRIPVESVLSKHAESGWRVENVKIFRTARVLMDGIAYVRESDIQSKQLRR